jgi:hypothetical protein
MRNAASLFERPPKLSHEKVERQMFDGKITEENHGSVCHGSTESNLDADPELPTMMARHGLDPAR